MIFTIPLIHFYKFIAYTLYTLLHQSAVQDYVTVHVFEVYTITDNSSLTPESLELCRKSIETKISMIKRRFGVVPERKIQCLKHVLSCLFGVVPDGSTTIKLAFEGDGNSTIVAKVACEVDLKPNLTHNQKEEVQEICTEIKSDLKCAGMPEDQIKFCVIRPFWSV